MPKRVLPAVAVYLATLCSLAGAVTDVASLTETRYCGTPVRDAAGNIKRSVAVLSAFQKVHPCPATGLTTGACPGWAVNHTIPLACGGCDAVSNMDWMPDQIKSCADQHCRDRWERKVYDHVPSFAGTNDCTNGVVKWTP
jgi:hypothetical protein